MKKSSFGHCRSAAAATSLLLSSAWLAVAQSPQIMTLKPPDSELPIEFSGIVGVRELEDGRVLVADRMENRLLVVDFRSGKFEAIGRVGSGPGEFLVVSPLFPTGADSTVMVDVASRGRWLIFHGARVIATTSAESTPFGTKYAALLGLDRTGRVLAALLLATEGKVDSLKLVSVDWSGGKRATGHVDTITRLRSGLPASAFAFQGVFGFPASDSISVPLARALRDEGVLFQDGWIAIVRRATLQVEWLAPTGRRLRGEPGLTAVERRELERPLPQVLAMRIARLFTPLTPTALPTPEGLLLVMRPPEARSGQVLYDLVDRSAKVIGRLSIPEQERVVGFGKRSVYILRRNDSDLESLRRHPWP